MRDPWDSNDVANSPYYSGKECIEFGCTEPAGTIWSPYWCWYHNALRMNKITKTLEDLVKIEALEQKDA